MEIVFVKEEDIPDGLYEGLNKVRENGSFQDFIEEIKLIKGYFTKMYIIDVVPCERFFCDQNCKPNKPGCREKYIENNHSIYVKYYAEFTQEGKEKFMLERRERLKKERENENK